MTRTPLTVAPPPDFLALLAGGSLPPAPPDREDEEADDGWEVLHVYSRAQALEDGTLIDPGPMAREAGFRFPVALTCGLWATAVAWTRGGGLGQSETGRLWDVLQVAKYAIRNAPDGVDRIPVTVLHIPDERDGGSTPKPLRFIAHIGPGDTPEPVLTFMLPNED